MYENGFQFLTKNEFNYFDQLFEERMMEKENLLAFNDFKDIVMNFRGFNRLFCSEMLDKIKKKLRERQSSLMDTDLYLTRNDYFEQLDYIYTEQNRHNNEKDPELKKLFDLLSLDQLTISKKLIMNVIIQFELPIKIDEFFSPIGKKDTLSFSDFCLLFKNSSGNEDIFLKSFSGSMGQGQGGSKSGEIIFPVTITKFKRE